MKIVAFTGESNSGKTTLIEKITNALIGTYKIAIIKNDPSNKAQFDTKGKDSYRFFETGADVIVTSPKKTTYFYHQRQTLDEIIKHINNYDFLFIEGLKYLNIPRIGIFRNKVDESYIDFINAAAIDNTIDKNIFPKNIDILDLNNIDQIIHWIIKNSKEVK